MIFAASILNLDDGLRIRVLARHWIIPERRPPCRACRCYFALLEVQSYSPSTASEIPRQRLSLDSDML